MGSQDFQGILTKESELGPKVHHTEEWEVHRHAIDERGDNTRSANIFRDRVLCEFSTWFDGTLVLQAIWLLSWVMGGTVTVGLRSESGVLRRNHHGNRIVDGQDHQSQKNCCQEKGLRACVALPDLEDGDPKEADAHSGNADD